MDFFVVDIWVVADRNAFNHPATCVIDPHSASESARLARSSFWKIKSSILVQKSSARPVIWLTFKKCVLLNNVCIIWCVDDHRVLTSRININARRSVIFCSWNERVTKVSHHCFLWGLNLIARTIFRIYIPMKLSPKAMMWLIGPYLVYRRQNIFWQIRKFAIILSRNVIVKVTVQQCCSSILVVTTAWSSFLAFCTWNCPNALEEL